jgi:hypothetical protein
MKFLYPPINVFYLKQISVNSIAVTISFNSYLELVNCELVPDLVEWPLIMRTSQSIMPWSYAFGDVGTCYARRLLANDWPWPNRALPNEYHACKIMWPEEWWNKVPKYRVPLLTNHNSTLYHRSRSSAFFAPAPFLLQPLFCSSPFFAPASFLLQPLFCSSLFFVSASFLL